MRTLLDATTTGTVTAEITSSSVDTLKTLTGTNAYTITIQGSDTGITASELTTNAVRQQWQWMRVR